MSRRAHRPRRAVSSSRLPLAQALIKPATEGRHTRHICQQVIIQLAMPLPVLTAGPTSVPARPDLLHYLQAEAMTRLLIDHPTWGHLRVPSI
jgi:hypothetical protein